jgi:hypothetical protein
MVVVDMFLKMASIIPRQETNIVVQTTYLYFKETVCLHRIPKGITSDQDVNILSHFLEDFVDKYENKVSIQ